jgi:hypothetical protein
MRFVAILALASVAAWGQLPPRAEPKMKPSDYPAHAELDAVSIGAEFVGRTISGSGGTFLSKRYIVFDVALYPRTGQELTTRISHFSLRLNGAKVPAKPVPPQFVAAELKYPDWEQKPSLVAGAGSGNGTIIVGREPGTERIPRPKAVAGGGRGPG